MGSFTLFAIILCALAVAFAISALWEKARGLAIALAVALPLAAGALYWYKGSPAALDPSVVAPPKTMEEAISQLEKLTRADPKNFADQATLARAYMEVHRYEDASAAYAKAYALDPAADLDVEYAEALLRTSPDRKFPPQAVALLEKALQKDPQNQRALFFLGLHQRQSGQPAAAVETWERLAAQLDAGTANELQRQIAMARKEAGMPAVEVEEALLDVEVALDPTLAASAKPGTVLYVFARSPAGGPPVAVKRLTPTAYPVQVGLGDADSPMPTAKLSAQTEVLLAARLSMTGDVKPSSGDLEADPVTVKPGEKARLTLSRSVP
jgi:cytochrome c-type biogenesis protein CcmH